MPGTLPDSTQPAPSSGDAVLRALLRSPAAWGAFLVFWGFICALWSVAYVVSATREGVPSPWRLGVLVGVVDAASWALACLAGFAVAWTVPVRRARPWPGILLTALSVAVIFLVRLCAVRAWTAWNGRPWELPFWEQAAIYASGHVLSIALFVAAGHGIRSTVAERERRLARARLEAGVARARLQAAQAEIRPGFLFAALAAVPALAERDAAAAELLLARLADMLRHAFRHSGAASVPLGQELSLALLFLEVEHARGGAPVRFRATAGPAEREAGVPHSSVFPLVEAAVLCGGGEVEVVARHAGGRLEVEVRDDAPLPLAERRAHPAWEGVRRLGAALEALGGGARLECADRAGGGVRASLLLASAGGAA